MAPPNQSTYFGMNKEKIRVNPRHFCCACWDVSGQEHNCESHLSEQGQSVDSSPAASGPGVGAQLRAGIQDIFVE